MPTLHIVIPTIDSREWLLEALKSVYDSHATEITDGNVLVTVIDDFSQFSFFSQADASYFVNLELIRNPRRFGLVEVFNQSISLCRGDLLQIMGHDDRMLSGFYKQLVSHWQSNNDCAIFVSGVEVIDSNSLISKSIADHIKNYLTPRSAKNGAQVIGGQRALVRLLVGNFLYFPALVFNINCLTDIRFSEEAGVALDLDLICRLLLNGNHFMVYSESVVFQYRRSKLSYSGITGLTKKRFLEEKTVVSNIAILAKDKGWLIAWIMANVAFSVRAAEIFRLLTKFASSLHIVRSNRV